MKLIPQYETKTYIVQHDDGRTEPFQTRAAATICYPQLGQQAAPAKQTKTQRRNERQQAGQRV
jgi:hypothetical protein